MAPLEQSRLYDSANDDLLLSPVRLAPAEQPTHGSDMALVGKSVVLMHITIEMVFVTQLRQLVAKTYGQLISFLRFQPVDRARKMKVWLSLNRSEIDSLMTAIMSALPRAEFGRIVPS